MIEIKDPDLENNAMMCYFGPKKKSQKELGDEIPDDLSELEEYENFNFSVFIHHEIEEITDDFIETNRIFHNVSKYSLSDLDEFEEEVGKKGLHTLFGLKHVDYIGREEALEFKVKSALNSSVEKIPVLEHYRELDDLGKEIAQAGYLLTQFVVPENNARKESLNRRLKDDNSGYVNNTKISE